MLHQQRPAHEKDAFSSVACPKQQLVVEAEGRGSELCLDTTVIPPALSQLQRFVTQTQAQGNLCLTVSQETFPPPVSWHFFTTSKLFFAHTALCGNDSPGLAV